MKIKIALLISIINLFCTPYIMASAEHKTDFGLQLHTSKSDLGLKSNLGKSFDTRYFNGANRKNVLEAGIFLRHIRPISERFFWGVELRVEDTRQKFKRKENQAMVGSNTFVHKRGLSAGLHGIWGMELGDYRFYGHSGMVGTHSLIKLFSIYDYGHHTRKREEILWGFSKGLGFDMAVNEGWRIGLQYAHIHHQSQKLRIHERDAFIHSKSQVHCVGIRLSSEF